MLKMIFFISSLIKVVTKWSKTIGNFFKENKAGYTTRHKSRRLGRGSIAHTPITCFSRFHEWAPCSKTTVKLKFLHQRVSHRFWYPTGCGNKDPYRMKSSIGQFLRKCCKKRSIGRGSYKRCGIDVKFVMDRQDQV